jgi:glycosyltransferase involved in cell wall biosynthesis
MTKNKKSGDQHNKSKGRPFATSLQGQPQSDLRARDTPFATGATPFVSVCTPTFNRRPFINIMLDCFRNQTYPKDRMEWIIVDDGTDKIQDMIANAADLQPYIKYHPVTEKMTLGKKRNYMHSLCRGDILVYMDDDDYYPPERVEHAVEKLQDAPNALCSGTSEIYLYFKHVGKMVQFGPYGPNHSTAGTFAFRKELLRMTRYDDTACLAEERTFLKEYTIPFVQLDPMKTILVFSHEHNTFDKRKLLNNQNQFLKYSDKTVDDFIRLPKEQHIKQFFMQDIDRLLLEYEPGEPKNKPDVLKQTKEIEEQRAQMMAKTLQQPTPIQIRNAQGEMVQLNMEQVGNVIKDMEGKLAMMNRVIEQQRQYIDHQCEVIDMLQSC